MQTVNVVVIKDNAVVSLLSFSASKEGNQLAEKYFTEKCKDLVVTRLDQDDIDYYLDEGICELHNGSICISHCNNND